MKNILKHCSEGIVHTLERFFYWYGLQISRHPLPVILICIVSTGLVGIGMLRYREENNAFKLWIPDNSDFVTDYGWLEENAPPDIRFNSLLVVNEGSNVLNAETLSHMLSIHKRISETVTNESSLTWNQTCYRRPSTSQGADVFSFFDDPPSTCDLFSPRFPFEVPCYPSPLCDILSSSPPEQRCFERSLLEIWDYDFDFSSLTQDEIIEKINSQDLKSQVFNTPLNIKEYLGGNIILDDLGRIVSAEATFMQWYGQLNTSQLTDADVSSAGTGQVSDPNSLEWEAALRDLLMEDQDHLPDGMSTYINVARGYDDIAGDSINGDAIMMPIGFMIVFVYVMIMLGKFNCIQQRSLLAQGGLVCIGLTILFTYGFCSAIGLFFSPMHSLIPFLILGLGIDDMFVIMQCYDNLGDEREDEYTKNIAKTMKHAGVAITVTSLTDFMVFAIGASTVLPALKSFCLWCGVGILACYFYQATVFTAFLALDCMRINSGRNGLCPFYKHEPKADIESNKSHSLSLTQKIFGYFSKFLLSAPGMVIAILVTGGLLGGGIFGCTQLEQEFDPTWFLPPDSYLSKWFAASKTLFPSEGEMVTVYLTEMDWPNEMEKVALLVSELKTHTDIIQRVEEWYTPYKNYSNHFLGMDNSTTFNSNLNQFLYSLPGLQYQQSFKWMKGEDLICGKSAQDILLSTLSFTHTRFSGRDEYIPAMKTIKDIISSFNFSGNVFPMTTEYATWETDEVITRELLRNLGLALGCVLITTLILLADLTGSLFVLLSVVLTLVDICGFMHYWGLTIDVVSSVMVIIAIGLCVDYSAHICHTFLTISGSRKDRAVSALISIGPAVLNGGLSTLIAIILLAPSDSHVFSTFFKIFLLVVVFGLFHGLVFLPVLLALVGPAAYTSAKPSNSIMTNQVAPEKGEDLTCEKPAPDILISTITLTHTSIMTNQVDQAPEKSIHL